MARVPDARSGRSWHQRHWPLPSQKDKGRLDGIEAPCSRIRDGPVYFIIAFLGAFLAAFFAFFAINFLLYDVPCSGEEGLPRPFLPTVSRIRAGVATVKTIPQKNARRT
jgi:hypothetical protein